MAYPRLVAFDLDGTVWSNWLNPDWFGLNGRVGQVLEDNLEIVNNTWIRDMRRWSAQVRVADNIPWIIADLVRNGVIIAITSRNPNMHLCNRAMWLIKLGIPDTWNGRPLTDFIKYNEIYDRSKQIHFERIKGWSGVEYHEMLCFDDQATNNEVEMWQGVTFQKVSNGGYGVTQQNYYDGLHVWRRNQQMRRNMPNAGPDPLQNRRQIGWVGTDRATAERYRLGQRRLKSDRPSRWGWGLYVADDPSIASVFAKWLRENDPDNHYVCGVWARDFDEFRRMAKVWVPENGSIQQTNSDLGDAHIAESQISRDEIIANQFGVSKPYILFARHHWMDILTGTWRRNHVGRFSEMVLPPQVQDALFYGQPYKLSDIQPSIDANALEGFDFRHKLGEWDIKWTTETGEDFRRYGEDLR